MIQLVIYLLLGAALFASLLVMALRRHARAEAGAEAVAVAQQALNTLRSSLLPPELVQRIFAREDFEFIAAEAVRSLQALFLAERNKIALAWVSEVRTAIVGLRRFYRNKARHYARLDFRTEIELALDFTFLVFACRALEVFLYVGGPYAAPRVVKATATAATRICDISVKAFAPLNLSALAQAGDRIPV